MKSGENQKYGSKWHQENENPKNEQEIIISFDQNFGENNFLEPEFQFSSPLEHKNRQNSMCFEHPFVITTPGT